MKPIRFRLAVAAGLLGSTWIASGCREIVPPAAEADETVVVNEALFAAARAARGEEDPAEHDAESAGSRALAGVAVDPDLPNYQAVAGVSGSLKSVGSDTMSNLMSLWAEGFKRFYPNVKIEIEGKGSSTAPPALIAGTADFGPMSRDLKAQEIDEFQARFGYEPTSLPAGIDMVAIYVHKDNPLTSLTMPEVDAIYSKTRRRGYDGDLRIWGDLKLPAPWDKLPISLYGRNAASGTYGYFKEYALGGGDFKDSVKEQPGSSSVVQGVASERSAIGYSGIGYKTADVRAVPLAEAAGKPAVPADPANAYSGDYPLARALWLNVNHRPGQELDPLRREFIRYVFSVQGQQEVIKDGYLPVGAEIARRSLESVGVPPEF